MKAAMVTFIGGDGAEGIDPYRWGGLEFPLGHAVLVDPSQATGERAAFMRHVLTKVGTHRHFRVEEVEEGHDPHAAPPKRGRKKADDDPPKAPPGEGA